MAVQCTGRGRGEEWLMHWASGQNIGQFDKIRKKYFYILKKIHLDFFTILTNTWDQCMLLAREDGGRLVRWAMGQNIGQFDTIETNTLRFADKYI